MVDCPILPELYIVRWQRVAQRRWCFIHVWDHVACFWVHYLGQPLSNREGRDIFAVALTKFASNGRLLHSVVGARTNRIFVPFLCVPNFFFFGPNKT